MISFNSANESIQNLAQKLERNRIHVDPYYQRGEVWDTKRQALLINSIMHKLYVPAIILRVLQEEGDGPQLECIDGKQRLTSIKKFIHNEFPVEIVDDEGDSERYFYSVPSGGVPALPQRLRDRFLDSELTVIKYSGLDEAATLEIFSRVQNGMSLTRGELYRGWNPRLVDFLKSFDDETNQISKALNKSARDGHNEFYIRCLYLEIKGAKSSMNCSSIDKFVMKNSQDLTQRQLDAFGAKLRRILNLILEIKDSLTTPIKKLDFVIGYWIVNSTNIPRDKLVRYLLGDRPSRRGQLTTVDFDAMVEHIRNI